MPTLEQALNYVFFFIGGVWSVMTTNWLLCVPIALFVIWNALNIIKNLFKILKKGE